MDEILKGIITIFGPIIPKMILTTFIVVLILLLIYFFLKKLGIIKK